MDHGRFTDCQFLRFVGRGLLSEFFAKFEAEVAVPPAEVSDETFFTALNRLLMSPEGLPDAMNEVLHEAQELSTEEGHRRLLEGMREKGLPVSLADNATPEELALRVWLQAPALLAQKYSEQRFGRLTAFVYYEKDPNCFKFGPGSAGSRGHEGALVSHLDGWFARNGRGDETVLIEKYDMGGDECYLIRHGDTFLRSPKIEKRKVEMLHYRPAKDDVVIYNLERDELRINAKTKGERELYRRAFGIYLHGFENYFRETKTYSLDPLRDLGAEALECHDIPGVNKVVLTQLEMELGKNNQCETRKADDVLACSWSGAPKGLVVPKGAKLKEAAFIIYVEAMAKPIEVRIKPPNMIRLGKNGGLPCVHQWMRKRGFKPDLSAK